ncbi:MAG: MFS transporter [Alphaproteobacteria bacterium]|nr:MFS transporter [Alphaproteobacteria bacterium]
MIALGTAVVPLDSAVNVAFPSITGSFGVPRAAIQWVVVCYVIVYATFLLIFGRLGDLFGHLRVFQSGLCICSLSFLGSGVVEEFEHLLMFRALQGLGSAMVLSCSPALTASLFPTEQRTLGLGLFAGVMGVGAAVGPSLAGMLVDQWGWPAVFLFRLPIAVAALLASFLLRLPAQVRATGRFDLVGAAWLVAGLSVFLLAVSRLRHDDISMAEVFVYIVIITLSGSILAFGRKNRGESNSVIPLLIFRNRDLVLVTTTGIAINFVAFAVMLFVPYYLNLIAGHSFATSGLILASSPIGIVVASQIAPRLVRRFAAKPIAFVGAFLIACGTGLTSLWGYGEALVFIVFTTFVHGFGLGLYQVAQLDVSLAALPIQNRGIAGSLVMMTRTLGVVLAASALTSIFVAIEGTAVTTAATERFLAAFQGTFLLSSAGLVIYLAVSCALPGGWFQAKKPTHAD